MIKPHTFSLLIKPSSYRCNIGCDYCFYKRVESVYPERTPFMTPEVAATVIRKSLRLGCPENTFCWQGGEPTLLGLDFYRQAVRAQMEFATRGQIIGNSLQTNGILLDDKWAEFLFQNRFLVGLSLDGPEDIHNRYRKYRSGEGTFAEVMRAAELLKKYRVEFNILCLLTDVNVKEPEQVYRFFRNYDFNHLQFVPCYERDALSGRIMPFSITEQELGEFHCGLFDLWLKDGFPDVSVRIFDDILIYLIDGVHVSCNWSDRCDSYLLVEHNGDVYPCDFFVYPEWKLGNVVEDSCEKIMNCSARRKFAEMKGAVPGDCVDCKWLSFCRGDCTKFRLDEAGGYRNRSAYCNARKMLLEHIEPHLEPIREKVMEFRRQRAVRIHHSGVGRNDPCPCGSGLKYKKCCGR